MIATKFYFSTIIVVVLSCIYAVSSILDNNLLDKHYVFTPDRLHALSKNAIAKHGNDTRAVVDNIVGQLRADDNLSPYLSTDEEWCFNNAGGAMGAMYIIHASECHRYCSLLNEPLTSFRRPHGILNNIRHGNRNRRPYWTTYSGRLLQHHSWDSIGLYTGLFRTGGLSTRIRSPPAPR